MRADQAPLPSRLPNFLHRIEGQIIEEPSALKVLRTIGVTEIGVALMARLVYLAPEMILVSSGRISGLGFIGSLGDCRCLKRDKKSWGENSKMEPGLNK